MKTFIILLLISFSVLADHQQSGEYRMSIKVGTGKITALKPEDIDIRYNQYELIFSKEFLLNERFAVEFGLGGGAYLVKDEIPDGQEMAVEIRTGLLLINPKLFLNKNISFGVFFTPFIPKSIRLSSTEMSTMNKGVNIEIRNCLINHFNCGAYYSTSEATTKRSLDLIGLSLGFDL